jgi:hypothetical protein
MFLWLFLNSRNFSGFFGGFGKNHAISGGGCFENLPFFDFVFRGNKIPKTQGFPLRSNAKPALFLKFTFHHEDTKSTKKFLFFNR